ncbi:btb poz domain protein [Neofusicoccum parvum]|nr:btb poz domain protein [Neofusicoccum parvum]
MKMKDGDGKVYNVHKFVSCGFPFFENAMKEGNFKEGLTNVVDLSGDDPAAVKAMLDFMYHGTYTYPDSIDFQGSLIFNLNVFFLSEKYLLNRLGLLEKAWLSTVDGRSPTN